MRAAYRVESGGFDNNPQKNSRKVLVHLLIVSVAVIILDITVIALEFSGLHIIQISYKELAYSIKLKLEISILNRLVKFVQAGPVAISRRVTTQDGMERAQTIQQTVDAQNSKSIIKTRKELSESSCEGHSSSPLRDQSDHRGGGRRQEHPAQDLAIESIV